SPEKEKVHSVAGAVHAPAAGEGGSAHAASARRSQGTGVSRRSGVEGRWDELFMASTLPSEGWLPLFQDVKDFADVVVQRPQPSASTRAFACSAVTLGGLACPHRSSTT